MSDDDDLTRIEDLSEFLHEDDPETDALLNDDNKKKDKESLLTSDINTLDDSEGDFSSSESHFSEESDNIGIENDTEDFANEATQQFELDDDNSEQAQESETLDIDETDTDFSSEESVENEEVEFGESEEVEFGESEEVEFGESEEVQFGESEEDEFGESEEDEFGESEESDNLPDTPNLAEEQESEVLDEALLETDTAEEAGIESEIDNDATNQNEFQSNSYLSEKIEVNSYAEPESATPQAPENFSDVKKFASNMSYGKVATGGNPAYSIVLKNIKFKEDAEDILIVLREHGLCTDQTEGDFKQGLSNGSLLISQISEFSAIYLTHKFRRFSLDILMGLSDEVHPSKSYSQDSIGLVTKDFVGQNKREQQNLEKGPVAIEDIIVTTTPNVENHTIHRYLGIITEHSLISESEIRRIHHASLMNQEELLGQPEEDEELLTNYALGLKEAYQDLALSLKEQALKISANGVIGLSYQVIPLSLETSENKEDTDYKITATANAVWLSYVGE